MHSSNRKRGGEDSGSSRKKPIFFDPRHRRKRIVKALFLVFFSFGLVWVLGFGLSIYYVDKLSGAEQVLAGRAQATADPDAPAPLPRSSWPISREVEEEACLPEGAPGPEGRAGQPGRVNFAYLPYEDYWSFDALQSPCAEIDVLLVEMFRVREVTKGPFALGPDDETALLTQHLASRAGAQTAMRPVVHFLRGALNGWEGDVAVPPETLARQVSEMLGAEGQDGACLLLEDVPPTAREPLVGFLSELRAGLPASQGGLCLVLQGDTDLIEDPRIVEAADQVILRGFHEPTLGSAAGPLAAQAWFEAMIERAVAAVGTDKLVIALGSHAYDWSSGSAIPEHIPFSEAMRRAARHKGQIRFAEGALNTNIQLIDADGRRQDIWALDAVSAFNQLKLLRAHGLQATAVWSLGYEDPGIWTALQLPDDIPADEAAALLSAVDLEGYVGYEGEGAFLTVAQPPVPGRRLLGAEAGSGRITSQRYETLPQPYTLLRYGNSPTPHVVLTFDDGPDAKFTRDILDILEENQATATFFQVGSNILRAPDMTRRIVRDGHEIGSHSFFHPRIDTISDFRLRMEMNALQRLFASVTGHGTLLFRAPYGRGQGPLSGQAARPVELLEELGYLVVGSDIIVPDWKGMTPAELVQHVRARQTAGGGNVIVMHDAGGDRQATIDALPGLIAALRADGYRIVSLSELIGAERDQLMPPVTGVHRWFDALSFGVLSVAGQVLALAFWVMIISGALRSLAVLGLAHIRKHHDTDGEDYAPPVTVLIPAYNEEGVILKSIASVLASDYGDVRLIVIDDGSEDNTLGQVMKAYHDHPRVTVITEPNQGKWKALDTAYGEIDTPIVVTLDADTVMAPDAIGKLVRHFRDPEVGAVSGNVKVGNRVNILTRLQALEYITVQNIDRRAAELLNGMLVVPGAIGAWRAEAVRKAGLYSNETLTEDADLTVSVLRAGYRVAFEERAYSIAETPMTVRAFMAQRLRWTFGMMQTGWKHRRAAREKRAVGLISIPDLFLFGVVLPLLAPFADLVFLATLVDFGINYATGQQELLSHGSSLILLGYLALPLMDLLTAFLGFRFERTERYRLLWLLPLQRLFYRPLLYISVFRGVYRVITGRFPAWGKPVPLSAMAEIR